MHPTSSQDFAAFQRETVRRQLERQALVFTLMLSVALGIDAIRLHPSAELATILTRLPIQIALCALVFVLLRYTALGARQSLLLGSLGYVVVAGFGGLLLGDLGGFDGPFFYSSYVLPTFVMMLSCSLTARMVLTASMVVAFLLAFFVPHPEHLDYRFAHIAFSYLSVIIAVNVYFGHKSTLLLEERFEMERALERHGRALAEDNEALEERVRRQSGSVSALLDRLESARHQTRTELARDLHDGMGQLVVGTRLELGQIDRALNTGEPLSTESLGYLYGLVDRLDKQVREMVRELRDPSSVDLLEVALEKLIEAYGNMPGLRIGLHVTLEGEPSDDHRETVVAVAREALTNAAKHARAEHIDVYVEASAHHVRLRVEDDGDGIALDAGVAVSRFGLVGMRERVEALGGSFGIEHVRTEAIRGTRRGTRVWARLEASEAEKA